MNKRFMRCVTLQQHATRLSTAGFSIPALLDVSTLCSSSMPVPLLFSTGVALGMFHDVRVLESGCSSSDECGVVPRAFRNEGNVFTAHWDRSV
ncbi:hypothetical protein ADUPG1_005674, partial [Aduncisulcus paluster]